MRLFKLNDDKYAVVLNKTTYEGTKNEIIRTMLKMGIEENEIYLGFDELEQNDVANYGINWKFMFAKKVA